MHKTLDAAISVQGAPVDYTHLNAFLISQHVDESATWAQMVIEMWIIDAQNLIRSIKFTWGLDATRGVI
jgi:hypothetical protein